MEKNSPIIFEPGREKLIVMPFQPQPGQALSGIGLGLHFLAGNLICLHKPLLECWFGWRVQKIFPEASLLDGYCKGSGSPRDIQALGEQEKVRFWLEGRYTSHEKGGELDLTLYDTGSEDSVTRTIPFSFSDHLLGFRSDFFDWLENSGLGFKNREYGSWAEKTDSKGLDYLGQALGALYNTYVTEGDDPIDLGFFHKAVEACPNSYLAQDLLGWGLYKNQDTEGARKAFLSAVDLNPNGMGAYAGLMWLALADENRDKALTYALEKGRCRGDEPEKASAFVKKKLG